MLKTKRGLIISQVFIYAISLVIIGIILIMGYKYISGTKDTIDKTDILLLKNKLTNDIESITSDFGSEKKVSYSILPSTELCLVDKDNVNINNLNDYPLIKDSLEDNIEKNAFLVGNSIFESFYIGELEINDPYFLCLKPVSGKINFVIEGKGNKALIKES